MVDAIVTWVDGSDFMHKEKRAKYRSIAKYENDDPDANEETRFADNNEIWYCINSIRKYALFINKIFLVTDNQKPSWLSRKLQEDFNIEIIDHSVLFTGYEDFLPTFNSQTIESMVYRIPEITERFIYFNDDVILINPVAESDFFERDKLIYRGDWQWKVSIKQKISSLLPLNDTFILKRLSKGFVGYRNEEEYFKKSRYRLFKLAHSLHPVKKSLLEQIFADEAFLKQQLKHRFRNKTQFWPFSLAANAALSSGLAKRGPNDYGYLNCNDISVKQVKMWLDFFEKNRKVKTICIQSLDMASPLIKKMIIEFLERRLNLITTKGG